MSNCTSSCKTQDHATYGECLKSNSPMFVKAGSISGQSAKDKELHSYYDALKAGVEPISTKKKDIDAAMRLSNDAGKAFNGQTLGFTE